MELPARPVPTSLRKNYTLSKDADFRYDLIKIDGADYVVIKGINLPSGFKAPEKIPTGETFAGYAINRTELVDTLTIKFPEKFVPRLPSIKDSPRFPWRGAAARFRCHN